MEKVELIRVFDVPKYADPYLFKHDNTSLYDDVMATYFGQNYGQSNFVSSALSSIGYSSIDVVANYKHAQITWAKEHGISFYLDNWYIDILISQINKYTPSVLFLVGWQFDNKFISHLKAHCTSVLKYVAWFGESLPDMACYSEYNLILTCDPSHLISLESYTVPIKHVNHAFSESLLIHESKVKSRVSFLGSLKPGTQEHFDRARILSNLAQEPDFDMYLTISSASIYSVSLRGKLSKLAHEISEKIMSRKLIRHLLPGYRKVEFERMFNDYVRVLNKCNLGSLYGNNYLSRIGTSKAVLNIHSETQYACNMRMFEVCGLGTTMICDKKKNMDDFFNVAEDVIVFKDVNELQAIIKEISAGSIDYLKVGECGQKKILANHTYKQRAHVYAECFFK